jgi:hypothetical protein
MPRGRSNPGSGSGPPKYPGTFLLAFREAVAAAGWQVRRWLGRSVECADADGHERVVGLENLYRRARRADRAEWPALIAEFLCVAAGSGDESLPPDLAGAADQLLVRLGPPIQAASEDARVWAQPLAGTDLWLNLVIDYPDRMFYVTEKLVQDSGRTGADWLERALANLRARTPEEPFAEVHEDSGLLLCNVGDAYDSSRALLVEALLPETPEAGCCVAVPSRDELVVLPITPEALEHIHLVKLLAEKNFKTSPYPISNEVFWVHEGVWRPFPITFKDDEVTVEPPPEFIDLLNRLTGEDEDDALEEPGGEA